MTSAPDDDFMCNICTDILFYPVVLPCKHKLCKQCLFKHIEQNGFHCPFCRERLSVWLRKIKNKKENLVDVNLWEEIQKKFPQGLERRNEMSLHEVSSFSESTRCQNVTLPKPKVSLPGEIRKEYEEEKRKEMDRLKQEEEKQMKLSEELIKMIQDEERKELMETEEQLRRDEELARRLKEEEELVVQKSIAAAQQSASISLTTASSSSNSLPSGFTDCSNDDTPSNPDWALNMVGDSPVFLGPMPKKSTYISISSTTSDQTHCSTPTPDILKQAAINISPIQFDMPSTSTDQRYGRFSPVPISVSTPNKVVRPSHFAPVPSTSSQGELDTTVSEKVSESRCSSGGDSISQELHHFKPICSSPTTLSKDGCSNMAPYIVVAQKAVPIFSAAQTPHMDQDEQNLTVNTENSSMDEDDQVLSRLQQRLIENQIKDLKKRIQQQIEDDAKLAREIEKAELEEKQKSSKLNQPKKCYNLRKRNNKTRNKKLLIDRAQRTLDNMLVKN